MTRRILVAAAAVTVAVVALPGNAYTRGGTADRVSVSSSGGQGNGDSAAGTDNPLVVTPDGRYVAFASDASNLVPGDVDLTSDVFVHDRRTGKTMIASVPTDGEIVGGAADKISVCGASQPAISADGRYVAFTSCAQYLDGRPTGPFGDVFVHDFKSGATTRVSVAIDLGISNGSSSHPSISADGRYVAFQSNATNLGPDPCPKAPEVDRALCERSELNWLISPGQIYVRDLRKRVTRLVSVGPAGDAGNGPSYFPSISADGRMIAFTSDANSLTANDKNLCAPDYLPSCPDVYVRDLRRGKTQLVSVGLGGFAPQGAFNSSGLFPGQQMISSNDRYVGFWSQLPGFVPTTDLVYTNAVYVRDLRAHRTQRVSVTSTGTQLHLGGSNVSLDATGRHVAFMGAPVCDTGDSNGSVVRYDIVTGALIHADRQDYDGRPIPCNTYFTSGSPAATADGRLIAFTSIGNTLVRGDTNNAFDAFVRELGHDVGTGGLAASGRLRIAGASSFAATSAVSRTDPRSDVTNALSAQGYNLIGLSIAYRPWLSDLFLRLQVEQMPLFQVADPAAVYGVQMSIDGARYRIRIVKDGAHALFRLFRADPDGWIPLGVLQGGYGTTGQEVVVALPLRWIGAERGGYISAVQAFSAVATTDGLGLVDSLALGR